MLELLFSTFTWLDMDLVGLQIATRFHSCHQNLDQRECWLGGASKFFQFENDDLHTGWSFEHGERLDCTDLAVSYGGLLDVFNGETCIG